MMRRGRAGRRRTAGWMWCVCCGESALLQRLKEMVAKRALTAAALMATAEEAGAVPATLTMVLVVMLVRMSESMHVGFGEIDYDRKK